MKIQYKSTKRRRPATRKMTQRDLRRFLDS